MTNIHRSLHSPHAYGLASVACIIAATFIFTSNLLAEEKSTWTDVLKSGDLTKHCHTKGNWILGKDGVVTLTPRPGERGWQRYDAYLWLKEEYKDFESSLITRFRSAATAASIFMSETRRAP